MLLTFCSLSRKGFTIKLFSSCRDPCLAKMSTLKLLFCHLAWKTRLFQVSSISDCSVLPRVCTVCAEGYVWDSWGSYEPFWSRALTCFKFSHIFCSCLPVGFFVASNFWGDSHMAGILQWIWSLPQEPHGCRAPAGLAGDQGVLAARCHLTATAATSGQHL